MKKIAADLFGNLGKLLILFGVLALATTPDLIWSDGRLTDFACYLLIGAAVTFTAWLVRLEYRVRTGKVNPYRLPQWLQDPSDGPEAGYRPRVRD